MRFDGDVEREPRIAQVKHLTRNVLDNLAEEEADAQAEIALAKHSEITIPVAESNSAMPAGMKRQWSPAG